MNADQSEELAKKSLSLLRVSPEEWVAIAETRRAGARFSLNFPHAVARAAQRGGLVLIATSHPEPTLRLGLIRSIQATSTFDSRIVFDLVRPISPNGLGALLSSVTEPTLRASRNRLAAGRSDFERISPKLGETLIYLLCAMPENESVLLRILAHLGKSSRYENARALQQDALALAVKAFGGDGEASSIALTSEDTAIGTVRLLEDAVIEHDARWMPGWRLADSDLTGRATFEKHGERLEVFTANKRPLEQLLGVDLIYLNRTRESLVMVQYKMLELNGAGRQRSDGDWLADDGLDDREWIAPIDNQFESELGRMRRFDQDLDPSGPYRLNAGAFYFKLVRRHSAARTAGILLSLGHLDLLIDGGVANGPRGGLRISYRSLDGHYLRSEAFVELVRSGYIGTRGATTEHLQTLIKAGLEQGRAVVAGVQSALAIS
jgi:hypothetical protein